MDAKLGEGMALPVGMISEVWVAPVELTARQIAIASELICRKDDLGRLRWWLFRKRHGFVGHKAF